jgi:hypothetical protein
MDSATFTVTFRSNLVAHVRRILRAFTKADLRVERVNAVTRRITLKSNKRLTASAINALYSSFFHIYLKS